MTDYRNATASWSGYLHQGKVGIFVALKEIVRLLSESKNENDLKNWRIIYENAEDFDIQEKDANGIIEDDSGRWRVESRHQVKATKSYTSFADYSKVLGVQHYMMEETEKKGKTTKELKKVLKVEGFQIKTFKPTKTAGSCDIGDIEVDEDSRFLHTIKNVSNFKGKNENLDIEPDVNHYSNNPNNVQLYEYEFSGGIKQKYCELPDSFSDKVKEESFLLIETIREKIGKHKSEDINIYYCILHNLDFEIRKEHRKTPIGYPKITLFEILNIIKNYKSFNDLEEFRLRNSFAKIYTEYKLELESRSINLSKGDNEYINKILDEIYSQNKNDFISFLRNIHPDRNNIISKNDSNICSLGLRRVFFKGISSIKIPYDLSKIGYQSDNKKFLLTTIIDDEDDIVSKNIIKNGEIVRDFFEGNFIVNKSISGKMLESINKLEVLKSTNWDSVDYIDKETDYFLDPRKLEFIKIDDFITKLNNNE